MSDRKILFELQPLDHLAGLGTFILVPFFRFQDFIFNDPVVFYEGEVSSLECDPETRKPLRINYVKEGFEGSIDIRNRYAEIDTQNVSVEYIRRDRATLSREFFHSIFTWHNPTFLTYLAQVITGLTLIIVGTKFHFWTIREAPTAACDAKCISSAYDIVFSSIVRTYIDLVLPLIAYVFFYFYYFKKIKDGGRASFVRFNGALFLVLVLLGFNGIAEKWQEESTRKAFEISYSNKAPSGRAIASELKENGFVKTTVEKPEISKPARLDQL